MALEKWENHMEFPRDTCLVTHASRRKGFVKHASLTSLRA
jgi:hypothetical protein